MDILKILEKIKASPYREIQINTPHSGWIKFANLKKGDSVTGPYGQWKEKPGTTIAIIERERNPKPLMAPEAGDIVRLFTDLEGKFVEANTTIAIIRHKLSRDEVEQNILKQTLYLFKAPERAKYYFVPEMQTRIRAMENHDVLVQPGMEIMVMSRMKREVPLVYDGPVGIIYAVYCNVDGNTDANAPLIGVCPQDQLPLIRDAIARVRSEWKETA